MILKTFKSDNLNVNVYATRADMGKAAAADVATCIKETLSMKKEIYMVFAAAPSQNEFLEALTSIKDIPWSRIHALHMDEYVDLSPDASQGFGNFLRRAIFDKVPFASVEYIGTDKNSEATCRRYSDILKSVNIDIVCMGIGENGHIAFNDPHVADFNDPLLIKKVDLDDTCRMQQVHDGCFEELSAVPKYALTLTIPAMFNADHLFCVVPASTKANAVKATVFGPVSEKCPASILRRHKDAVLYTDSDSAKYIID